MKRRPTALSLVEVVLATGISLITILFTLSISVAITRFTRDAVVSRIADMQVMQGVDAVAKELRDGLAILPSANIGGQTYTTSSNTIVLSAISYDFSKPNPILTSTDTVAFKFAPSNKLLVRSCSPGNGSKRPAGVESTVTSTSSSRFKYMVSEAIESVSSSTSTVTDNVNLSTVPSEQPVCTRNGATVPCLWQSGKQSISVQNPPGVSSLNIQYYVIPSATNCNSITSVEMQVQRPVSSLTGTKSNILHTAEARLRNKR